ncbi:MAG: hypothetical protein UT02_C0048G0006 [Parcubacteria group bacterium GW2011_GWC2_38_7]|nr:MAG: hypothetical protein UT02_C0048G0006 [Parcubacteria group bacterium GW2011_GWC2_38_7]
MNDVETVLHCGDWCAPSTLKYFRENFTGLLYGVYGNVHDEDKVMRKIAEEQKIIIKEDKLELEIDGINMMITHYPETAQKTALINKYHMIFYGHDHKPWKEVISKTYIINPGTLAGMFYKSTFALYDTQSRKLDLVLLDELKQ